MAGATQMCLNAFLLNISQSCWLILSKTPFFWKLHFNNRILVDSKYWAWVFFLSPRSTPFSPAHSKYISNFSSRKSAALKSLERKQDFIFEHTCRCVCIMSHYTSTHYLPWKIEASATHGQEKSVFHVITVILCMFSCRCGLSFVKGYIFQSC